MAFYATEKDRLTQSSRFLGFCVPPKERLRHLSVESHVPGASVVDFL